MGKTEEGVSPVVGVMLMLSVTVIIAAIVSAAAGSFSGTGKKPPPQSSKSISMKTGRMAVFLHPR